MKYSDEGADPRIVSCDVWLASVSDEATSISGAASAKCRLNDLAVLAEDLATQLSKSVDNKGESVAVLALANRVGTDDCRAIAEEVADKLTVALAASGWFDVKERMNLQRVLDARTQEQVLNLVRDPGLRERTGSIRYVVLGGVTVSTPEKTP